MTQDPPVTIAERYARASSSGNLAPLVDERTDLDVMIAAGIASKAKPDRIAALKVQRMIVTGELGEVYAVVEHYDGILAGYLSRKGRRPMHKEARRALIVEVLHWMMFPKCEFCGGTGKMTEEGTAGKLYHTCSACHGATIKPLSRAVPHHFAKHAHYLVDDINQHSREALKQMNRLLRGEPQA